MVVLRRGSARGAVLAFTLVVAATGLGLTVAPPAAASCAGPQLRVQQDGATIAPRREGEGLDEQLLYDIDRDRPFHVEASNLTFSCVDTYAGAPGCGAPPPPPPEPEPPLQNAVLQFEQQNRRSVLASLDVGPDLRSDVDVQVPATSRPGKAQLLINDPKNGDSAVLTLVLT